MKRRLYRMVLAGEGAAPSRADWPIRVVSYEPSRHHEAIRQVYGRSFGDEPWPDDWDRFGAFDPDGAFVAEDSEPGEEVVGYVLGFSRREYGYISVLAVVPEYRRQGVALALVAKEVEYLRGLGLKTIRVDAFVDQAAAVGFYRAFGFEVEREFEDGE